VAPAVGDRAGGYTRIVRVGKSRLGDKAPLARVQLVDRPAAAAAEPEEAAAEAKKGKKGAAKGPEKARKGKKEKAAAAE
jgi:large subunit ribosomal protein L17